MQRPHWREHPGVPRPSVERCPGDWEIGGTGSGTDREQVPLSPTVSGEPRESLELPAYVGGRRRKPGGRAARRRPGRRAAGRGLRDGRAAVVELPDSDRAELARWLRAPSMPAGLAQRARIVLLAGDGLGTNEIVSRTGGSKPTGIA